MRNVTVAKHVRASSDPVRLGRVSRRRVAFTLVELLVVIAIIGILIALLLPAIQAARASARRATCKNNLKNLGVALHNYHSSKRKFPPASTWDMSSTLGKDIIDDPALDNMRKNWVTIILPFLELQAVHDMFDFRETSNADKNGAARLTSIEVMLCPEDGYNITPFFTPECGGGTGWARGNYAANAALGYMSYAQSGALDCASWSDSGSWHRLEPYGANKYRGVMGANDAVSIDDIKDGSSRTILVAEVRAGITEFDPRGTWALGTAGASALWGHGRANTNRANGPNPIGDADGLADCTNIQRDVGTRQMLAARGMGCHRATTNRQAGARSSHDGGVQAVFADGSVHFLGDFVDTRDPNAPGPYPDLAPNLSPRFSVWDRLCLSNDGEVIPQGAVDD